MMRSDGCPCGAQPVNRTHGFPCAIASDEDAAIAATFFESG